MGLAGYFRCATSEYFSTMRRVRSSVEDSPVLVIPPTIGRARLRQTAAGLRIAIPLERSAYRFFLSLGISAFIVWALQARHEDSMVVLLLCAVMILVNVARNWFWNLLGEEIVTANKVALSVRYDVWGIGWTRNFFVNRISRLHFLRLLNPRRDESGDGAATGFVGFDYDSDSPRFGRGLSETEAQELIAVLEGYTGVALSSARVPPGKQATGGILAEEVNRHLGVTYLMLWAAAMFYFFGTLLDITVERVGAFLICLLFAGVAVAAAAGYRYRFTSRGIEISTLGVGLRFIPADRITHYEQSKLTFADSFSIGIFGEHVSYLWVGTPVRIQTLDGEFVLGHIKPAILLRDLELMKQAANEHPESVRVAGAGAS